MKGQVMTNVIQFPKPQKNIREGSIKGYVATHSKIESNTRNSYGNKLVKIVHLAVVLVWPILKWLVAIDVTWRFFRMIYFWNTPGSFEGWTFLMHFAFFVWLMMFVSNRRL
jgi:hypothetical protein